MRRLAFSMDLLRSSPSALLLYASGRSREAIYGPTRKGHSELAMSYAPAQRNPGHRSSLS